MSLIIGNRQWSALPQLYRAALTSASYEAHVMVQAKYDASNPQALARLIKRGVKVRPFPMDVMKASLKATKEVMAEEASKNANFKKIYEHYTNFQDQQNKWYSVAEQRMQNFQIAALNAGDRKE